MKNERTAPRTLTSPHTTNSARNCRAEGQTKKATDCADSRFGLEFLKSLQAAALQCFSGLSLCCFGQCVTDRELSGPFLFVRAYNGCFSCFAMSSYGRSCEVIQRWRLGNDLRLSWYLCYLVLRSLNLMTFWLLHCAEYQGLFCVKLPNEKLAV